jgi:GNAT superfamily N-acetyltransferase
VLIELRGVAADVRAGRLKLIAAFDHDRLVGSVQLLVRRPHRRRGIGRSLVNAARGLALRSGRTLLLLDVRTGDPVETLYRSLGFVKFGEVPGYARGPSGPCRQQLLLS